MRWYRCGGANASHGGTHKRSQLLLWLLLLLLLCLGILLLLLLLLLAAHAPLLVRRCIRGSRLRRQQRGRRTGVLLRQGRRLAGWDVG